MEESTINNFHAEKINPDDLKINENKLTDIPVIEAKDGQLVTKKLQITPTIKNGFAISDPDKDILKIVVVNRYYAAPVAIGFIKNFGLKSGAIASTVAHDSHNLIAVGANDSSILKAINLLIEAKGGICYVNVDQQKLLPLPVAGLMSTEDGYMVAKQYTELDQLVKAAGSKLSAPFMTLSFMALLVIPSIKLSDKGMFNGDEFKLYQQ